MELLQAKKVLNVHDEQNIREIKLKYRRLLARFHPDNMLSGADEAQHIQKTQEINEAYRTLKKHFYEENERREKTAKKWNLKENPKAEIERNIYRIYETDDGEELYAVQTTGKYMWNPEEEEFSAFLKSIHHATQEWMESEHSAWEENTQEYFEEQVRLFHRLAQQFVDPIECLKKLEKPRQKDHEGRDIYGVRAFLWVKACEEGYQRAQGLEKGDTIYPESFQGNRIIVQTKDHIRLGHLSLMDDALCFCLIPLLKEHKAAVKLIVHKKQKVKHGRIWILQIDVRLWFRLND